MLECKISHCFWGSRGKDSSLDYKGEQPPLVPLFRYVLHYECIFGTIIGEFDMSLISIFSDR